MKKHLKNVLILVLFLLSLSGLLIHSRVHPFASKPYGMVPFASGLLSVIVLPILFYFRKTIHLANLMNGFTAILGTITMVHFSLVKAPLIADLLFLWAKFCVGTVIFSMEIYNLESESKFPGWRYIRYPNMGFWYVHLAVWGLVYYLGNLLWR